MNQAHMTFAIGTRKSKDLGIYPILEGVELIVRGEHYELGYAFRDYGKLSLAAVRRLEESGTIGKAPKVITEIVDSYKLPSLLGSTARVGGKFTRWMIDAECTRIGVLSLKIGKRRKKTVFLGPKGNLFLKAAVNSPNMSRSFEDLTLLKVMARKITNYANFLKVLNKMGAIDCYCIRAHKSLRHLHMKRVQLQWKDLYSTLYNAYLIHSETPIAVPYARSSNNPVVLSGLVFNEIYRTYHALRTPLQVWINQQSKGIGGLVIVDPFELSDRMPREVTRALEKIKLLRTLSGIRYTCLPDQLLSDLATYFGKEIQMNASFSGMQHPKQISLDNFVRKLKEEFRILIKPDDVINFLRDHTEYRNLGIDLRIIAGRLISNYRKFTERLESLGLATIRPDGDVMIRIE